MRSKFNQRSQSSKQETKFTQRVEKQELVAEISPVLNRSQTVERSFYQATHFSVGNENRGAFINQRKNVLNSLAPGAQRSRQKLCSFLVKEKSCSNCQTRVVHQKKMFVRDSQFFPNSMWGRCRHTVMLPITEASKQASSQKPLLPVIKAFKVRFITGYVVAHLIFEMENQVKF